MMSSSIHDNKIIIYLTQDYWRNICHSKNSRQVEAHHLFKYNYYSYDDSDVDGEDD